MLESYVHRDERGSFLVNSILLKIEVKNRGFGFKETLATFVKIAIKVPVMANGHQSKRLALCYKHSICTKLVNTIFIEIYQSGYTDGKSKI